MKIIFNRSNIKRVVYTVLGYFFLLLGVLGLFLPILQGLLFIAIGLSILATHNAYFERLKFRMYGRFPRLEHFSERVKSRMRRIIRYRSRHDRPVVYYVSAHGYGHSVRTCDVIMRLRERYPEIPIILRTATPSEFFRTRLRGVDYTFAPAAFDVGLVQLDSLRADLDSSLRKVEELIARRGSLVNNEAEWLKKQNAAAVVADIPAIPFAAAERAEIPSLAVANFSWDWIYAEFVDRDPRWQAVADAFAEDYAKADLLVRLPFSGPMPAFGRHIDVGLLARPGADRRAEIAAATGADSAKRWILICFWSLEWDSGAQARIGAIGDYEFFTMPDLKLAEDNIHSLCRNEYPFSDIVASVDAVLSKPGYGILSDCIANNKPLAYAERNDFREYAVLVENIRKYLKHARIPMKDLYAGNLGPALDSLWEQSEPIDKLPADGADEIVDQIAPLCLYHNLYPRLSPGGHKD